MSESTATGPLVSVIVAAYKQPAMLNEALASIAAQTYQRIEIVVVDDASGPEHVAQYRLPANARLYVNETNVRRASIVRNRALQHVRGEFVAFLDQDDLWRPEKIARQVAALQAAPQALMCFTTSTIEDMEGHVLRARTPKTMLPRDAARALLRRNMVRGPSCVLMRRKAFDVVGPFDEEITGSADWDMWLRTAGAGPNTIVHLRDVLTCHREHGAQWSREGAVISRGSLAVMRSAQRWLPAKRPDLVGLGRRRMARWLCRLAKALWRNLETRDEAKLMVREAVSLNPLDFRTYWLMLRMFFSSR